MPPLGYHSARLLRAIGLDLGLAGGLAAVFSLIAVRYFGVDSDLALVVFIAAVAASFVAVCLSYIGNLELTMQPGDSLTLALILALILAPLALFGGSFQNGDSRTLYGFLLTVLLAIPLGFTVLRGFCRVWDRFLPSRQRILICGAGDLAPSVFAWVNGPGSSEFEIAGVLPHPPLDCNTDQDVTTLQEQLDRLARSSDAVDRIVLAHGRFGSEGPPNRRLRAGGIPVETALSFLERNSGRISADWMPSDTPWIRVPSGMGAWLKRALDLTVSTVLLVLSLPLMALIALAIRLEGSGPVLFRQERVGLDGRNFCLLKFRSMVLDAESLSGPAWAGKNDPRITPVGRVLRKFRLDELPQLIHVLRGEMSLVGPRPERPHFAREIQRELPQFDLRTRVQPGITGWAQVQQGYTATDADARLKLMYDTFYIKNWSVVFDFLIVLMTVRVVLSGSGAR